MERLFFGEYVEKNQKNKMFKESQITQKKTTNKQFDESKRRKKLYSCVSIDHRRIGYKDAIEKITLPFHTEKYLLSMQELRTKTSRQHGKNWQAYK